MSELHVLPQPLHSANGTVMTSPANNTPTGRFPLLPELTPRAELALLCRILFEAGYDDHIAGHISYRQSDGSFLVNPWELPWDEICASDVMRVDEHGKVLDGPWQVTPAYKLHMALHNLRPDANVIVHNHSHYGTLWACSKKVPPIYDQTSSLVDGELVLYNEFEGMVVESDAAEKAARALGDAKWALLANHGVLVTARDIRHAHLRSFVLEHRCRIAWELDLAGKGSPLPAEHSNKIGALVDSSQLPFYWEALGRRMLRADPRVIG